MRIKDKGIIKVKKKRILKSGAGTIEETVALPNITVAFLIPNFKHDMWWNIEEWNRDLIKLRPEEIKGVIALVAEERKLQFNKFASTKDKSFRKTMVLPVELNLAIKRYFPQAYDNETNLNRLARMFPGYCVAEKI